VQHLWNWVAGWLPSPVTAWLAQIWSLTLGWMAVGISWFLALFGRGWLGGFSGMALAIVMSFCVWWSQLQWRKWRHRQWLKKLPPVERIYRQMLARLTDRGIPKHPAQTPLEYAEIVRANRSVSLSSLVTEISQAYTAWRYGQEPQQLARLQGLLKDLQRSQK